MRRRSKIRYDRIIILILIIGLIIFGITKLFDKDKITKTNDILMLDFINKELEEIKKYSENNDLVLNVEYEYNDTIEKDHIISQSIEKDTIIKENDTLNIIVSLGVLDKEKLKEDKINELGNVPIMMYHGIVNKKDSETDYIGGNVDKDGYNRTTESFRRDLEFYYEKGNEMILYSLYPITFCMYRK